MMVEADEAHSGNAAKTDRASAPTALLDELPYIAIIVLGLIGISWTSISSTPTATYWVILTPITAFICIAAGWRRAAPGRERVTMVATQIGQWASVLVGMYLITVSDTHGLLNSDAIGLMLLTLLALGVIISGLSLRAWKLCVTAAFLALAVPIIAWVERAGPLLLLLGGALIALEFLDWWVQARVSRRAA